MTPDPLPALDDTRPPKAPPRVVAAVLALMAVIAVLSAALFYFIAFGDLSARGMRLAGLLYLLAAGPLFWLLYRVKLPYR